jgi:leader peptidase (prepilin peptidase)/N-methyltransferase
MTTAEFKSAAAVRFRSPTALTGTVLLAALVMAVQPSTPLAVLRGAMVLVLVPCALIDMERRIIPNRITGPAALAAIILGLALDAGHEPRRLAWAAGVGGFLLLTALINPAGMGMGDVKLLAVIGLFLGRPAIVALVVALVGTVLAGVVLAKRHGVSTARKTGLPFGPYLAAGGILAAVLGDVIIRAYVGH